MEVFPFIFDNLGRCLSIGRLAVSPTDGEEAHDHWKNLDIVLCDPSKSKGPSGGCLRIEAKHKLTNHVS